MIALTSADQEVRAEQLVQYIEKDPALPGFRVSRPAGWEADEQTLKQNSWKDYGRTLKYFSGNRTIEVSLQPIDSKITKLSDLGSPETFANAFANSASRVVAPPSTANPSPVPKVSVLGMEATPDLRRTLAQYRMEVRDRPNLIFQQLVGIAEDSEKRNYLYSLTAAATEEEFDRSKDIFVEVFKSFEMPGATKQK